MSETIYLVASDSSPWVQQLRAHAHAKYDIVPLPTALDAPPERPARGVIVYYEQVHSSNSLQFSRMREDMRLVDLPLVAVTHQPTAASRARLLASGAAAVCDADAELELVFKEIENRCNLEPVVDEIRKGLLDPFVYATLITIREMAQCEPAVQVVYRKTGYRIFGDHSALVSVSASTEGTVVLSFPRASSQELSRRMLEPLGVAVTEELVQSCLAETANIIVGQAKGALAGTPYAFAMSVPTVIAGTNHEVRYKPGLPCLVASFTSAIGDFALQLCMAF
jgi:CheY-specific phosphatase CheX